MTKLFKDLFKNEKRLGRIFAIMTTVALVFTMLVPGTFAAFWRTLAGSAVTTSSTTDETTVFKYGWGYGDSGWGYGWGYGYDQGAVKRDEGYHVGEEAYESPTIVTAISAGEATIVGTPTSASQITMTDTVGFSPGGGIQAVLPQGLEVTQDGGGNFDATAISAAAGSAVASDIGANFSINGSVDFGLGIGGTKLIFSLPVKIVIPLPGVPNGTSVSIAVKHTGEGYTTGSLSTSATATCNASGGASPTATTATVSGGAVTIYTCAASQFASYSSTGGGTVTPASPSGGGGGGTSTTAISADSNTATSSIASAIASLIDRLRTYTRPLQLAESLFSESITAGTKTAMLTGGEGEITLKPNRNSTIWAVIPANTSITGTIDWDGRVMPPLLRSDSIVSTFGEKIEGSSQKVKRSDVDVAVKAGSSDSPLTFSKSIELVVPVDLADGTAVQVLHSSDGATWGSGGTFVANNGQVAFNATHFSYFVLSSSLAGTEDIKVVSTGGFRDIVGHWAQSYITAIANMGIVSGKTALSFAPDDQITRAELTKVAVNAFNVHVSPSVTETPFIDVATDAWYAPYVKAAKDAGVVEGFAGGGFSPNVPISRAEALKILIEAAGFEDVYDNYQTNYASKAGWYYVFFPDVQIGQWYSKYVAYAKDFGIVSGYSNGDFKPGNFITRAEVAKVVTKILDLLQ